MKKLMLLSFVALLAFACNKLTTKNIVGTWKVTEFAINGTAIPTGVVQTYEFMDDGNVTYYEDGVSQGNTSYTVSDDGKTLTISGQMYTATEKKGKVLKFEYVNGTDTYSWTMEKQ